MLSYTGIEFERSHIHEESRFEEVQKHACKEVDSLNNCIEMCVICMYSTPRNLRSLSAP